MPDPRSLGASEAELRGIDPWTRARVLMERQEASEEIDRREREYQLAERAEALRLQREAADRVELAQQGFLTREAEAAAARLAQERAARIAELREELDQLTGRGESWRPPTADDVDRQLAEARRGAQEWDSGACRRARIAALEDATRRHGPPPPGHSSYGAARRARPSVPRSSAGSGRVPVSQASGREITRSTPAAAPPPAVIPLSRPDLAHMLPGDW